MNRLALVMVVRHAFAPGISSAGVPISNLEGLTVPVKHDGTHFSLEEVQATILDGCAARGWAASVESEGRISASILVRGKHLAQIAIPFNTSNYSLVYVASENLDYSARRQTIHRNYRKWVLKLSRTIGQKFTALLQTSQRAATQSDLANSEAESERYLKLLQLGELRDKGIITEDEFETEKRKPMD